MAGYRQFHTKFWKDEWLIDLEPLERYLFCYLFTNDLSSISGIYKLPRKVIINETGLDPAFIDATLGKFQACKKIFYQDGVMWVVKMQMYHKNASPTTMAKVRADIAEIPECNVKKAYRYYQNTGIYCIDTVSIQTQESLSLSGNKSLSGSETPPPAPPDDFPEPPPPDDDSDDEDAEFVSMRKCIERETGLLGDGVTAVQAIDEMLKNGCIEEDIVNGIKWRVGEGKRITSYSQLVGPANTARLKRIQGGNGHSAKTRLLMDAKGNLLEVPA